MCPPRGCDKCGEFLLFNTLTGECGLCKMRKTAQELYEIRVKTNRFPVNKQIPFPPRVYYSV